MLFTWALVLGIDAAIILYKYNTVENHLDELLRISLLFLVVYLFDSIILLWRKRAKGGTQRKAPKHLGKQC